MPLAFGELNSLERVCAEGFMNVNMFRRALVYIFFILFFALQVYLQRISLLQVNRSVRMRINVFITPTGKWSSVFIYIYSSPFEPISLV